MINKYYINIQLDEINNAGSKAVNDCNQILKNNGVKPYTLNIKKSGNKYLSILNKMIEFEKIKKIEKTSLLFVPHPIYINKKYYIDILKKAKEKRNLKLVFLIHDLDSLRKMFPESDKEKLKKKITEATSGRVMTQEGEEVYFGTVDGEVIVF